MVRKIFLAIFLFQKSFSNRISNLRIKKGRQASFRFIPIFTGYIQPDLTLYSGTAPHDGE